MSTDVASTELQTNSLSRYHVPDEAAIIRGEAEGGSKGKWDSIYNPEEDASEQAGNILKTKERLKGGGINAVDLLFENADAVDPELRMLFPEFMQEVYGEGLDGLLIAAENYQNKLEKKLEEAHSRKAEKDEIEKINADLGKAEALANPDVMAKLLKLNFVKWNEADKVEEANLLQLPEGLKQEIKKSNGEEELKDIEITSNVDRISLDEFDTHRIDMQIWLSVWKAQDAGKKALVLGVNQEGKIKDVALKTQKLYGIVKVDFDAWKKALGGKDKIFSVNGHTLRSTQFGEETLFSGWSINDDLEATSKLHRLKVDGAANPSLELWQVSVD